jgi:excisionase family DNA binding protein
MAPWPYPGDSPTARARRVAHAYRARLQSIAPDQSDALDHLFTSMGEIWVAPRVITVQVDEWLTPEQAADLGGVGVATLRAWRSRGRLTGVRTPGGEWRYRAGDILALITKPRGRTRRGVDIADRAP